VLLAWCVGWFTHRTLRWVAISSAVVLLGCWFVGWRNERTWNRITALPLSGGYAIYVQPKATGDWLIDCGSENTIDFTLKPFLQANGVNHLSNFLLTHGDVRQIGGAVRLNKMFPVRQAFASPVSSRSPKYREALSDLETNSKLRKCATNGFASSPWMVLHPNTSDRFSSGEDAAVVMLGTFDGVRVLLTSDLGKAGQSTFVTRHPDLRADVVIAGLPSAGEPLATAWLDVLRPKLIVIADSEFPATRRASRELNQRLQRTGATLLFTRQAGAVTFSIREGKWRVDTAREVIAIE